MRRPRTQPTPATQTDASKAPSAPVQLSCGHPLEARAFLSCAVCREAHGITEEMVAPYRPSASRCCHATWQGGHWHHHATCNWRKLVHWPDDERLTRRHLQLWSWTLPPNAYVLLRPGLGPDGKSLRCPVVAETMQGTILRNTCPRSIDTAAKAAQHPDPANIYGDDVLLTRMRVHWWSLSPQDAAEGAPEGSVFGEHRVEECDVHNAHCLRYVTEAALANVFLWTPLPDSMWDYTCEHPDAPCVRQPGPPQLVANITEPIKGEAPRKRAALDLSFMDED